MGEGPISGSLSFAAFAPAHLTVRAEFGGGDRGSQAHDGLEGRRSQDPFAGLRREVKRLL